MPDADRRVPTAADVPVSGQEWWFKDCSRLSGTAFICRLHRDDSILTARVIDQPHLPLMRVDDPFFAEWLGPVNHEPMPWPEGGR